MPKSKATKAPHLKLIQGGKTDKPAKEKTPKQKPAAQNAAKPDKTQKVHPFANFMGRNNRGITSPKPNTFDQVVHHQIPRKKVV